MEAKRRRNMKKEFVIFIAILCLAGCASKGPVLYPNAHLKSVGEEKAHKDIEECEQMADAYIKSDAGKAAARSMAGGVAGGAVVGGAVGAVTGNLGRGLGIGAAAGAASGLVRGVSRASKPTPLYKSFVDRCLREKGYEPIGWQ